MKKILVIWLLLPCLCISQNDNLDSFFYKDENGLVFLTDMFYDYFHAEGEITDEQKQIMKKALKVHQNYISSNNSTTSEKIRSYKQLLDYSGYLNQETEMYSEAIYDLISNDIRYKIHLFDVVHNLVTNYNSQGKYKESLQILDKHREVLENHKNFTCGVGARVHYNKLGMLFFDTYQNLNYVDEQVYYGFKYLLNNKVYSNKLVELIATQYSKEDLQKAFKALDSSFVEQPNKFNSYFKFLDYKIGVDGVSGIFRYHKKSVSEQLKTIWFYKSLSAYLSK
ncbi:hypothetical protein [uncultured Psychroserpens sp.]|uniref:hypothetical protein n=1 Tax=uncultured Psychroserpens sp. TaxID=255436 RepID=UPI002627B8FA|nr:hypothetical protein [uncultured Psychroserpens sp.]